MIEKISLVGRCISGGSKSMKREPGGKIIGVGRAVGDN